MRHISGTTANVYVYVYGYEINPQNMILFLTSD